MHNKSLYNITEHSYIAILQVEKNSLNSFLNKQTINQWQIKCDPAIQHGGEYKHTMSCTYFNYTLLLLWSIYTQVCACVYSPSYTFNWALATYMYQDVCNSKTSPEDSIMILKH